MAGKKGKDRFYNLHWQAVPMDRKSGKSTMPLLLRDLDPGSKFSPKDLWTALKAKEVEDKMKMTETKQLAADVKKERRRRRWQGQKRPTEEGRRR
jgi:hypothetical protein